jgi:hypothetical protein
MPIHVTTTTTQTLSNKSFSGPSRFNGDVTIFGDLACNGTQTFQNTIFSTTSAISVIHVGSGPALLVGNNGDGDIASFYDLDQNIEVLHVGGNNGTFPNVGVKTSTPNVDFTVNGEISASSTIYDSAGNSDQWNSAYTTLNAQSAANTTVYSTVNTNSATTWNYQGTDIKALTASWQNTYTNFSTQSAANASVYSTVNSKSASWDSVYSGFNAQSAANATVYSTVNSNSATTWNYQGTDIKSLTASWQNTYTNFSTQSANNISVYSSFNAQSAANATVYSTVNTTSATWLQTLSFNESTKNLSISNSNTVSLSSLGGGGGGGIDTGVRALTGSWDSTYTTVNSNSAAWGGDLGDGLNQAQVLTRVFFKI